MLTLLVWRMHLENHRKLKSKDLFKQWCGLYSQKDVETL
jgi:hypothetical protein